MDGHETLLVESSVQKMNNSVIKYLFIKSKWYNPVDIKRRGANYDSDGGFLWETNNHIAQYSASLKKSRKKRLHKLHQTFSSLRMLMIAKMKRFKFATAQIHILEQQQVHRYLVFRAIYYTKLIKKNTQASYQAENVWFLLHKWLKQLINWKIMKP